MQAIHQAAKRFATQESFFALLLCGHEAQQVSSCRLASQHANQHGDCICFQHLHRQTTQRQGIWLYTCPANCQDHTRHCIGKKVRTVYTIGL